ncbi:MAG: type II secretion system F family protein [Candidatus Hydrogenedentes bacterium]|nr:type II secretion system F family protein [Candidatus Hydrogenedentota bacterium]
MPEFTYDAIDPDGKPCSGKIEGESPYNAALSLSERGFRVNSIKQLGKRDVLSAKPSRLGWQDLSVLTEQLQVFTQRHLPLPSALGFMAKEAQSGKLRSVLEDVQKHVEMGESLEQAMGRHSDAFPPVFLSLIRAGEQTGNLPAVLNHLATYSNRMTDVRNALREMLAYPAFLLVAALAMLGFLSSVVMPQFEGIYQEFGKELPKSTQIALSVHYTLQFLMSGGALVVAGKLLLLVAVVTAIVLAPRFIRHWFGENNVLNMILEKIKISFPVLGPVYTTTLVGRFCRTLGLLLSSRAQTTESLILAGTTAGSGLFRQAGLDAAMMVSKGETMTNALSHTRLFRPSFLWLLGQAEQHGEVGEALVNLAEVCEREVSHWARLATVLVGPLFVAVIGLLVLFTLLAVFLPVINLSSVVSH